MKASQLNYLARGQSVSSALETLTATNMPTALTAAHAALKTTISDIRSAAATQALPTTGLTQDRDQVFTDAVDATLVVAGLVLGYAKAQNLGDLAAKVDLPPSSLAYGRFITRVQLMQQVHDAAAGVLAKLADYGVTAVTLTDLQTKIDAAGALLSTPRTSISARRVATEKLAERVAQLNELIDYQLDPLMEARRETDPDGYKLYQAARLVIDRPGTASDPAPTNAPAGSAPAAPTATSNVTKLAA